MRNLKQVLLSILLILNFACTKSGGGKDGEKVVHLTSPARVKGFDPNEASDMYSGNEIARVYEGLLQFHYLKRPYTLVPNLTVSMPEVSTDGLTYVFKLKKGVLFHDNKCFAEGKGREMNASDVVYSIKRLADPKLQSKGWWLIDGKIAGLNEWREKYIDASKAKYEDEIEGVKVIDNYTVQFKLTKPFPQFLYAFAMPFTFVVAKEAVEHYGQDFLNNPVGTGPFVTKTFTQTNKIIYTKNPTYREEYYPSEGAPGDKEKGLLEDAGKRLPLADKVIVNIITESQTRWLNFMKGKLEFVAIPVDQFTSVFNEKHEIGDEYKAKGIHAVKQIRLDVTYNAFNNEHKLFKNNVKLRQAISMALDREKMNKSFFYGLSLPAKSMVPPDIAGYVADYAGEFQTFNLEKAKKSLKAAGYPNGKGLPTITYHYKYDTKGRQMAEMMKQDMAKIGVKIKLMGVTWPDLVKTVNTKNSMMYGMAWGADYPDAENFLQLLYSPNAAPGANGSNYHDAEYDKMYEQASVMADSPKRTALYEKMYKYASDQAPVVYNFHRVGYSLFHKWMRNYKFIEFNHGTAKYYSVDNEIKDELLKKL